MHVFRDADDGQVHLALVRGAIDPAVPALVRVQGGAALRDLLCTDIPGEKRNWNAARCLERIDREDGGVLVLLSQPETERHLLASVEAALGAARASDAAPERPPNVQSLVGVGSQILRQLGVGRMRLMGPPIRYNAISGFGLEVVEHVVY
jgi:3,4-dihydroxy 2-butanone 4-phosphate synthase/GTP cyclohydrolase II